MSVCPSVRMNAEVSETIQATILGLDRQIPEIPAQRSLIQQLSTPTNRPKLWLLQFLCYLLYAVLINTYRLTQKKFATPTLKPTNRPQTKNNRKYERGYLGNYQR